MKAHEVLGLRVVIERHGMRVAFRTRHETSPHEAGDEVDEGRRAIEFEEDRGLLPERVGTDTAPFFVTGETVPVDVGLELLDVRDEALFHHFRWQKSFQKEAFVLVPVLHSQSVEVERPDRSLDLLWNVRRSAALVALLSHPLTRMLMLLLYFPCQGCSALGSYPRSHSAVFGAMGMTELL